VRARRRWTAHTSDGPRLPAGVRARPAWLASGMKTGAHYAVRSQMFEVSQLRTAHAQTDTDPTLRLSIVRERWRASRLPSSVGASRP
jgi:hypothetical protein